MKKSLLIICSLLLVLNSGAQNIYNSSGRSNARKPEKKSGFNTDKLVLGGDFRLPSIFNGGLSVGLSPMVGYQIVDNLFVGATFGYNFDRFKVDYASLPASATTNVFNYNSFSGGLWVRYLFLQNFYIHAEAAYFSYQNYYYDGNSALFKQYDNAPSLLAGLGFKQAITDRVSLNTTFLYDFLQDPKSYYVNRTGGLDVRFGILVGF